MHEMSLAEGIRRIVDQATDRPDVTRVTRVPKQHTQMHGGKRQFVFVGGNVGPPLNKLF